MSVLACQADYRLADLAAKFTGELLDTVRGAAALADTALTVRTRQSSRWDAACVL